MNILDKIIAYKRQEVFCKKKNVPEHFFLEGIKQRTYVSLAESLSKSKVGIIAEYKRRSPSKHVINFEKYIYEVVENYQDMGGSGISVLTDTHFFGGSIDDLIIARTHTALPILRKDFIIDTYQISEAAFYGADVILLIASVLTQNEILKLSNHAFSIGLEVLLEVHNEDELDKIGSSKINLVGVNNRNLSTFDVDIAHSLSLSKKIPSTAIKISESGISNPKNILKLREAGYKGFLIGEKLMSSNDTTDALKSFLNAIQ